MRSRWSCAVAWLMLTGVVSGCSSIEGVGDPCRPEWMPDEGFPPSAAYLETSLECRTETCLVYQFGSEVTLDLSQTQEECLDDGGDPPTCARRPTEHIVRERVFCTCRCSAPGGDTTGTCRCPCGFTCQDDLVTTGPLELQGGYCVRDRSDPSC